MLQQMVPSLSLSHHHQPEPRLSDDEERGAHFSASNFYMFRFVASQTNFLDSRHSSFPSSPQEATTGRDALPWVPRACHHLERRAIMAPLMLISR